MSLATRCPRCQTVFRVVPDQLRVSEGWVRCGRCSEVFNAAWSLVDPSTGEARRAPIELHSGLPAAADMPTGPAAARPAAPPADRSRGRSEGLAGDRPDAPSAAPAAEVPAAGPVSAEAPPEARSTGAVSGPGAGHAASSAAGATTAQEAGLEIRAEPRTGAAVGAPVGVAADATVDRAGVAADMHPAEPGFDGTGDLRADADAEAAATPAATPIPSFLRRAERAQQWRRPAVRAALAMGVLVAMLALGAQWLFAWRDYAAARWPALQPRLAVACAWLGCRLQPWRAIDALVVDSSGVVRIEKSELYRLSVTLRNQRDLEVALPAFDLALTDTQGRLIARRVLRAGELGATAPTLAPGGEVALQATIRVAAAPVAGYTIEIFHP